MACWSASPQSAERGRDAGGREDRGGQAHVAVGERLGDQHGGDGGALADGAAELLRHAEHRQAELGGLGEQLGGRLAVGVGLLRGRPQLPRAELA